MPNAEVIIDIMILAVKVVAAVLTAEVFVEELRALKRKS
ncbi:Uncharacterised protein [uncultured archaeon]|nr:Uncharacterised protein [uncultured archaeon]